MQGKAAGWNLFGLYLYQQAGWTATAQLTTVNGPNRTVEIVNFA